MVGLALVWLSACSTPTPPPGSATAPGPIEPREGLAYYAQSVTGHLALMRAARPLEGWLADPATPPALKERLAQVQRMRRFAVDELHLPDNASYTRYADLGRRAVVWNVVATPEFSLQLNTWCFVVVGCVGYRGYFDEAEAHALAERLRAQGLDAVAYPVPAYSTLGWTNWLGGDPVLSTFIGYPEGEVARLLFHELAHQVLYVADDTEFNESFATAVERLGGERWLAQASPAARADYAAFDERRRAFRALTLSVRKNLEKIYAQALDGKALNAMETENALRASKHAVMADFRQRYAELKAGWGGHSGYDAWVERANNASFAVQAAYDAQVPAFMALFEREGRSFPRWYAAVRRLAQLPTAERDAELARLMPPPQPASPERS
jgi:predicted aminopeptidase